MTYMDVLYYALIALLVLIMFLCCIHCRRKLYNPQGERPRGQHTMIYSVTMQGDNGSTFHNAVTEFLRASNEDDVSSHRNQREAHTSRNISSPQNLTHKPAGPPSYDEVMSGDCRSHPAAPPPYSEAPPVRGQRD